MNKLLITSLALAISTSSFTAMSTDKTPGSGPNPFSDCGIGAAIFSETKWAAVSSNVIWDIGTTAVTSATASPQTCTGAKVVAAKFIIDNYDNLVEEIAEGSGTHLTSMYNVLGCSTIAQEGMTQDIRTGMSKSLSQANYQDKSLTEKSLELYNSMNNSASLTSCAVI